MEGKIVCVEYPFCPSLENTKIIMNITSAKFIKGAVGNDFMLENDIPQVAFIGRSNAGKSSLINALTNQKNRMY